MSFATDFLVILDELEFELKDIMKFSFAFVLRHYYDNIFNLF